MSERIDDLRTRICSLRDQLVAAQDELLRAQTEECPVKVGSIVREKRSSLLYIVRGIVFYECNDADKPSSIRVSPKKKNGEWSKNEKGIYHSNYEIVE